MIEAATYNVAGFGVVGFLVLALYIIVGAFAPEGSGPRRHLKLLAPIYLALLVAAGIIVWGVVVAGFVDYLDATGTAWTAEGLGAHMARIDFTRLWAPLFVLMVWIGVAGVFTLMVVAMMDIYRMRTGREPFGQGAPRSGMGEAPPPAYGGKPPKGAVLRCFGGVKAYVWHGGETRYLDRVYVWVGGITETLWGDGSDWVFTDPYSPWAMGKAAGSAAEANAERRHPALAPALADLVERLAAFGSAKARQRYEVAKWFAGAGKKR